MLASDLVSSHFKQHTNKYDRYNRVVPWFKAVRGPFLADFSILQWQKLNVIFSEKEPYLCLMLRPWFAQILAPWGRRGAQPLPYWTLQCTWPNPSTPRGNVYLLSRGSLYYFCNGSMKSQTIGTPRVGHNGSQPGRGTTLNSKCRFSAKLGKVTHSGRVYCKVTQRFNLPL